MKATNRQNRRSGSFDGPQPKLIVLKLRNRMVPTIRAAGTSITNTATNACAGAASEKIRVRSTGCVNGVGHANTVAAAMPAAGGLGSPTKYRLSVCVLD